ncbi:MAG TPA: hypothetical protein VMS88_04215, partial [Terriglobales bacterium]|nr:hypothetical protein [Terriglobales bacterium]
MAEHPAGVAIARLGDAAAGFPVRALVETRGQSQVAHQIAGPAEALDGEDLRRQRERGSGIDAGEAAQQRRRQGPLVFRGDPLHDVPQTLLTLLQLAQATHELLERGGILAVVPGLGGEPGSMSAGPVVPVVDPSAAQQELQQVMTLAHRLLDHPGVGA